MKTQEELNVLKDKAENLNEELKQLTDDELEQVAGGRMSAWAQNKLNQWG